MNLPTREACLNLLEEYKVPTGIQKHIRLVNKIAVFLAKKLREKGININIKLVDRASLLHDITKSVEFKSFDGLNLKETKKAKELKNKYTNISHENSAYLELKNKYPEVADVIKVHTIYLIKETKTWEQKIVNYADKIATEDKIVTLRERFKDLESRYNFIISKEIIKKYYGIQKEIFNIIGMRVEDVGKRK